jgi:hypothetical protein
LWSKTDMHGRIGPNIVQSPKVRSLPESTNWGYGMKKIPNRRGHGEKRIENTGCHFDEIADSAPC